MLLTRTGAWPVYPPLMPALLKNGTVTRDVRCDRLVGLEEGNLNYDVAPLLASAPRKDPGLLRTKNWACDAHYDQGSEGRCVEYAFCHELRSEPLVVTQRKVANVLRDLKIYHPAQHTDPWAGCYLGPDCPILPSQAQYEGTSVAAGAHQAKQLGFIDEYRWAFSLEDALLSLVHLGPLVIGVDWYDGMFTPDAKGRIRLLGGLGGGHSVCVLGLKAKFTSGQRSGTLAALDQDQSLVKIRQSWGKDHGLAGDVFLSVAEFDQLRRARGEVCIPVRRARG